MFAFREDVFCKLLASALCILIAFEAHGLAQVFDSPGQQKETETYVGRLQSAKNAYLSGDYETAKATLEELIASIVEGQGWDFLKAEAALVLGASYEKLGNKELAVKNYCRAKETLGEGISTEGLDLTELEYYKEKCEAVVGVAGVQVKKKKSAFGKVMGTVLFLASLGGVVWYLFFSKNAPFGKKKKDE